MSNISLFWSKPPLEDQSYEDWLNQDIELSNLHKLALDSHIRLNNDVRLFTYQNFISDIPNDIKIVNASNYYDSKLAYEAMIRGHKIAHISDVVRLQASIENDAVVLDMDAVMINQFPDYDCFTSSMYAKKSGALVVQFGKIQPKFNIKDGSWNGEALSVFPFKVHSSIAEDVQILINRILKSLSKKPYQNNSKSWNYIMWSLRDIANKYEHVHVMQPKHCCPVPAWRSAGKCYSLEYPTKFDGKSQIFGVTLLSIDDIMEQSYCIQHFFESSFKESNINTTDDFWNNIPKGSLLDVEANLIYGPNWKVSKNIVNTLWD